MLATLKITFSSPIYCPLHKQNYRSW